MVFWFVWLVGGDEVGDLGEGVVVYCVGFVGVVIGDGVVGVGLFGGGDGEVFCYVVEVVCDVGYGVFGDVGCEGDGG